DVPGMAGTAGRLSGLNDHQSSGSGVAAPAAGQSAPWSIHARRTPTSPAVSRFPSGGIAVSPTPATNLTSGLSALLPGMMAGLESPPLSAAALASRRRPFFCLAEPWQAKQCLAKIGRTSVTK